MVRLVPRHIDVLLKVWAAQARLQPAEAEAAYYAVLRRAATEALDLEAASKQAVAPGATPAWKVALEVANEVVLCARTPLWGSSWVPPVSQPLVG